MWHRVLYWISNRVSEESAASAIRVIEGKIVPLHAVDKYEGMEV